MAKNPSLHLSRRALIAGSAAGLAATAAPALAQGKEPVKVGELNSYSRMAAFCVPYRNAMQLALEEINAKGGVLGGRRLEFIFRDDGGTTGDATRVAEELVTRENVSMLAGTFLSNIGLAVADYANQRKVMFLASEPLSDAVTMAQGNRYTFRIRPNNTMQVGMLVDQAKASGAKRWPRRRYRHCDRSRYRRRCPAPGRTRRRPAPRRVVHRRRLNASAQRTRSISTWAIPASSNSGPRRTNPARS